MVAVAALVLAAVLVTALALVRPIVRIGSPTVALAAPAVIDGLPKTADYSSQPVTVLGRHILDVASATYGSGDVHYAVVAISGAAVSGDPRILLQTLTPQVAGDDTIDTSSASHLTRSGVDYTCWRMNGAAPGVTCMWNADGVAGVVVQVGSTDAARCAGFADVARRSVRAHG